jgi:hypothetical protein
VLICAGVQTPALFGPLGVEFAPHTRVTYQGADAIGAVCLSAPEGYGLPLGSTGRWAFGQQVPDPAAVHTLFPALSPVGQVDCVTVRAGWLDTGGDGWTAARRGPRRRARRQQPDEVRAAARRPARSGRAQRRAAQRPDPVGAQREPRLPRWRRCGPQAFRWWTRLRARGSHGATIAVVHTTAYWSSWSRKAADSRYGSSR